MIVRPAVHTGVMVTLVLLAMVPLAPVFADPKYWVAVVGGTLIGTGVALLSARWRSDALTVAACVVVGYFVFGGLFAARDSLVIGILPSLSTLRDLALTVVLGWKQLLTVSIPVNGFDHLFAVPYLAVLVVSSLAVSLAIRSTRRWTAILPLAALLVFAIAFGESGGLLPNVVGAAFTAIALGWTAWCRSLRQRDTQLLVSAGEARRGATRTAVMGLVILLFTGTAGSLVAAAPMWDRTTLREHVTPPLELRDYASPLMSFRKYVEDGEDSVLFRVSGVPKGANVRLASMDYYDGIVYKVSGAGGPASGVFVRAGRQLPGGGSGASVDVKVQIEDLSGVWVPDVGYPTRVDFTGPRTAVLESGLHYNAATGTAIQTAGLQTGDGITFAATLATTPSSRQLDTAKLSSLSLPPPVMIPDAVQDLLDDATAGAETPVAKVRAIENFLREKGFLSHGLATDKVQSRPGHTFERLSSMLEAPQLIGDDEQYAVLMALMLARSGIPARVVMGFAPEITDPAKATAVTGKDVHAWVEVPFDQLGWVSFNPTPTKEPEQQAPESRLKPRVQVPQPPLPPQEPADLPPQPPDAEVSDEELGPDLAWLWRALRVGGMSLGVLAVIVGPGLGMLWLKARRRERRRSAPRLPDRVSGGWDEVVEADADIGHRLSGTGTRREHAAELHSRYPMLGIPGLAGWADAAVFAPGEPTATDVTTYWAEVEAVRRGMHRVATRRQRLRGFFWPTSVMGRRPRWWRWN